MIRCQSQAHDKTCGVKLQALTLRIKQTKQTAFQRFYFLTKVHFWPLKFGVVLILELHV